MSRTLRLRRYAKKSYQIEFLSIIEIGNEQNARTSGGIAGGAAAAKQAHDLGFNPWTGNRTNSIAVQQLSPKGPNTATAPPVQKPISGTNRIGVRDASYVGGDKTISSSDFAGKNVTFGNRGLQGSVKSNYQRFVKKIPANSKSNVNYKQLKDGNYLFEASSPGKVPGSRAVYQKWVNPRGQTFHMIKTTYGPDGNMIHIKTKTIIK